MRVVLSAFCAALALTGCDSNLSDNQATASKPAVATPAAGERAIQASFDCGRANGQAQELVCADASLAAMDREVARLAGLAAEPAALADYTSRRDGCWKSDELKQCVMAVAMLEIHRLRQGSEAARSGQGASLGPVAYSCAAIAGGRLLATFVNSEPGAVTLQWNRQTIAIPQATTATGARYDGRWEGQSYAFWTQGKEATLTISGKGDFECIERGAS